MFFQSNRCGTGQRGVSWTTRKIAVRTYEAFDGTWTWIPGFLGGGGKRHPLLARALSTAGSAVQEPPCSGKIIGIDALVRSNMISCERKRLFQRKCPNLLPVCMCNEARAGHFEELFSDP